MGLCLSLPRSSGGHDGWRAYGGTGYGGTSGCRRAYRKRQLSISPMATIPSLPEAEQDVLGAVYDLGEATARDVREQIARRRPLAHASIVTLLGRLEEKGLVRRRKGDVGKAFIYSATTARTRTFGPMLSRLVRRAFQGNSAALVASLFESRPPDAREMAELEGLLEEWRARGSKGTPK